MIENFIIAQNLKLIKAPYLLTVAVNIPCFKLELDWTHTSSSPIFILQYKCDWDSIWKSYAEMRGVWSFEENTTSIM